MIANSSQQKVRKLEINSCGSTSDYDGPGLSQGPQF